jgi:hypothetical protein
LPTDADSKPNPDAVAKPDTERHCHPSPIPDANCYRNGDGDGYCLSHRDRHSHPSSDLNRDFAADANGDAAANSHTDRYAHLRRRRRQSTVRAVRCAE